MNCQEEYFIMEMEEGCYQSLISQIFIHFFRLENCPLEGLHPAVIDHQNQIHQNQSFQSHQ
jgi:hypothetical protein